MAGKIKKRTLESKLQELERLEEEHGIVTVGIRTESGVILMTEDVVDVVIGFVKRGIEVLKDIDNIPLAKEA